MRLRTMRFMPKRRSYSVSGTQFTQFETTFQHCNRRQSLCEDAITTERNHSREREKKTRKNSWNTLRTELKWFLLDVVDSFKRKEVCEVQGDDGELIKLFDRKTSFSIVELRRDLSRLTSAARPVIEAIAAIGDFIMWVNPLATLLLALVYMYSIWIGYLWPLVFLVLILQLALNYVKVVHNVDIGINLLPRKRITMPKLDMSSGQLLIAVAKIAQCIVKFLADILEKLESLFTWQSPEISFHFLLLCVYWLMWSLCFSIGTCYGACGMTFGIRLFLTTYLFNKFPRLRYRLDTYGYFYRNLPLRSGEIPERPLATDARSFPSSMRDRSFESLGSNLNERGSSESLDESLSASLGLESMESHETVLIENTLELHNRLVYE